MIITQYWALSVLFKYVTDTMLWYLVIGVFDLGGPVKEGLPAEVSGDLKTVVTD